MHPAILRFAAMLIVVAIAPVSPASSADAGTAYVLRGEAGVPVADVRLSVVGRSGSVRTGPDGAFRLVPPPVPPFDVVVFDDAGAVIGTVRVEVGDDRDLVLVPVRVESVRVVSGVAPSTPAPPAAAATVLSREETERVQPTRLVDALEEVPGAAPVGTGQAAVPAVRGLARGRTLILLDDARVTAERRAGASATYLNPFVLESVEIVRGPGSVDYGSDALGGVLHARTSRPRPGVRGTRFEFAAGAGVPFGSAAVETHVPVGGASALLVQAHGRRYGDYETPEGREPNSSARSVGGLVRGVARRGRATLSWGVQFDRGRDLERPAEDTDRRINRYPEESSDRFSFGVDLPGSDGWTGLEVRAFVGRYRLTTARETFATPTSPTTVASSVADAGDASLRAVAGRSVGRGRLRFGADLTTRFGLETVDRLVERPAGADPVVVRDQVTIESARRIDAGTFVEWEQPLAGAGWSVTAGARLDHVETRNEGGFFGDRSTADTAPSGFLALRAPIGRTWDLTVQAARGFRDPTLSDRYFRGVTGRGVVTGNPELEPETSRQLDLALRGDAGPVRVGAFAYLYRIEDLIERFEVAPDEFAFRNRGEQELVGAELELDLVLSPTLAARAALQWARGTILDDDSPAADVAAPGAVVTLDHRPNDRWWWRVAVRADVRDDRPGEQEVEVPGFATVDLSAGWRPTPTLEWRVLIDNVLDRARPASSDDSAPLAPGRAVSVVLSGRFGGVL